MLDTNVLAYAVGVGADERRIRAGQVIAAFDAADLILPSQVAGELFNVLTRKDRRSRREAGAVVADWIEALVLTVHSPQALDAAVALSVEHDFQIWDALILAIAAEAGCALLLSEDMRDGFVYRGVTVANPFAETPHPLLASVLESPP